MSASPDAIGERPARAWARALELAVAGAVGLALTLDPYILNGVPPSRVHTGLPLLMLGISGAFADGLGFSAANRLLRVLLHPIATWALIVVGAALMILQ